MSKYILLLKINISANSYYINEMEKKVVFKNLFRLYSDTRTTNRTNIGFESINF